MGLWLDQRAKRSRGHGGPRGTASKTLLLTEISLFVLAFCLDELDLLIVSGLHLKMIPITGYLFIFIPLI